jgi:hypothetical protein
MIDIVLPKNNEKAFIIMAEKLGLKGLVFLYSAKPKDLTTLQASTKLKLYIAGNKKGNILVVKGRDIRHVLEKGNTDLVYGVEESNEKDSMHYRRSGLNQVLCKIATSKKRIIALSLSSILSTNGITRSILMGRMIQNIKLCRKYKTTMALCTFATTQYGLRTSHDVQSVGITLGMTPGEAKQAVQAVQQRLILNKKIQSKQYLGEGVEKL